MEDKFVHIGQGPATPVNDGRTFEDLGYTNPDLYRKVDPRERDFPEVAPRQYDLGIYSKDGYLTTTKLVHNEKSTTTEIP